MALLLHRPTTFQQNSQKLTHTSHTQKHWGPPHKKGHSVVVSVFYMDARALYIPTLGAKNLERLNHDICKTIHYSISSSIPLQCGSRCGAESSHCVWQELSLHKTLLRDSCRSRFFGVSVFRPHSLRLDIARFHSCSKLGRIQQAVARRATHEKETFWTCRCCVQWRRLRDGGFNNGVNLDCMERIDSNDLRQLCLATISSAQEHHWTTLTCRLSTRRIGCCAVAVHNRYSVVMGGYNGDDRKLSSVDIIDISNNTVVEGPSMTVPRACCASAVVGKRIFVISIETVEQTVEYLDFPKPCYKKHDDTSSTVISSWPSWTVHSDLVLADPRSSCAMVAVGSCLVVAGDNGTVEILDTNHTTVCGKSHHTASTLTSVAW